MLKKKVPLRKCLGCQEMKSKKELIRVVRNDEGEVFIDFTGKKAGRGAYICADIQCLEKAHKSKGFERSLKTTISQEVYDQLKEKLVMEND